jgi:hypothetical protein
VHRFAPAIEGKSVWMNRWRVGTLDTFRTLDAAAGAVVHARGSDDELADPAFVMSDRVRTSLLVMFGFDENIERLRRMLADAEPDAAAITSVVDALILDLTNELLATNAPGWMGDAERGSSTLHRLDSLERLAFAVDYGVDVAEAIKRLAARVLFLADSQVAWWEGIPPFRWIRRGPASRTRIEDQDRYLGATFGAQHEAARADVDRLARELILEHKKVRKTQLVGKLRPWAVDQARLPIAEQATTSDTELLATCDDRVMTGAAYDTVCASKIADRIKREALLADAADRHAKLFVK